MYRSITLPNGAKLLTEFVPGARTAALGFFVGTGSRHERAAESGAAHFIEHMSFKGTQRRDAGALARETDAIGGQINAYTTKELTCYYARCLDSHLHRAIDLLSDMLFHSRFAQGDVELERGVILEEIGMYEDTPEDLAAERLAAAVYQGSPLSRPILGKASTLNKMTGGEPSGLSGGPLPPRQSGHRPPRQLHPQAVEELRAILSELEPGHVPSCKGARYRPAFTVRRKPTEQNHLILAFPAFSYLDPRRYQLLLLNSILGGGVSSRLFQELAGEAGAVLHHLLLCSRPRRHRPAGGVHRPQPRAGGGRRWMLPAPCSGSWRSTAPPRRSWSGPGSRPRPACSWGWNPFRPA